MDQAEGAASRVPTDEALAFAKEFDMDFIEVSAHTGQNVEIAFRRCILSVAKLLPDARSFLELNGLPTGWLKVVKTAPPATNSDGSERKPQGGLSSSLKSTVTVYINYWTGEEHTFSEPPFTTAPTKLLYESNKDYITEDVSFRDSRA